ncbi:MAG: hypothetical protein CME71_01525 [Halobacteriovorax sp.]|nr:hypothetical protein [Halobacteriovorax sp.]
MKTIFYILFLSLNAQAIEPPESTPSPTEETSMVNRLMGYAMDIGLMEEEGNTNYVDDSIIEIARSEAMQAVARSSRGIRGTGACLAAPGSANSSNDAVRGARLLMATMYQSCEAPNITISNSLNSRSSPVGGRPRTLSDRSRVSRYNAYNPYLANRSSVRNGCFNVLEQPPIYGYGAKPSISNNTISLHDNQARRPRCGGTGKSGVACSSQPVSAIDCSGFITGALRRMGLKMNPREEFNPGMINTAAFNREASTSNSCLDFIEADRNISIVPGDIINIGSNHVIMVDEVGDDPLGLKRHSRNNTCGRLSKSDFDFKFLHSGAAAHFGVARLNATHPEMSGFMSTLEVKVRQACNQIRNGSTTTLAQSSNARGLSVIRHAGDSKPGCKGEPEVFENEGCVSGCGIL